MKNSTKGFIFTMLAFLPLGASYPIAASVISNIPVFLFTEIAMIFGVIIAIPLGRVVEPQTKWRKLGKKVYLKIFLQSLIGVVIYTILNLYGLKYCNPVIASVIASLCPAATMLAAFVVIHEKITIRKLIGVVCAVVAVILMTVDFGAASEPAQFAAIGIVFMCLAVASQVAYFLLAKQISYEMEPFSMTVGLLVPAVIMMAPVAIYQALKFDFASLSGHDWFVMVFYGVMVGYVAYLTTYLALKYVSATYFSTATATIPVASAIVSVLFYSASLRVTDVIGILLVVISIVIIENRTVESEGKELSKEQCNS